MGGHHLAHEKEHGGEHEKHYVCPQCSGEGFVGEKPSTEREKDALHRYADGLKKELEAAEKRIKEL